MPLEVQDIDAALFNSQTQFGPVTYNGLTWVGEISTVSMEFWVRGADGKAIRRGNRRNLLRGSTIRISPQDFLPPMYHNRGPIILHLDRFRDLLAARVETMACDRCGELVEAYLKSQGDDGDHRP